MGKRFPRRHLLKLAAAGSTATLPAVAMAAPDLTISHVAPSVDELPVDRAARLGEALGEVMNDYLDGRFYANVFPSNSVECNIVFHRISRSLDEQLERCVGELKSILRKMNPSCPIISEQIMTDVDGGQLVTVSAKPSCFTGDGYYEIRKADGSCIVCHVRQYPEGVRGDLYAAPFVDGYTVGPRSIVSEHDLIRRVEV